jgi:hypothetical protein
MGILLPSAENTMKKWCVFLTIYASSLPCIVFAQDKQVTKEQQPKSTPAKEKPTAAKANPNSQKQPVIKFSMAMLENDRIDPKYTGFSVEKIITAIEYIMPNRRRLHQNF